MAEALMAALMTAAAVTVVALAELTAVAAIATAVMPASVVTLIVVAQATATVIVWWQWRQQGWQWR